jgi:hypothetical protein
MLKDSCAYSYIFETPPPANSAKMRKYNASPHPFVLQFESAGVETAKMEGYTFNLTLFGHGQKQFPYILHAMQRAGHEGIGGGRQQFQLERVEQINRSGQAHPVFDGKQLLPVTRDSLPPLPPAPAKTSIHFLSPVRIKQQGKNLTPDRFEFGALFGNVLRRISMLTYFHGDIPLETDFARLTRQARELNFSNKQLQWYDWKRYSSRQQTEMNMGGVIGTAEIDLTAHPEFWPYLWLGQWTHAGKATSMGMGQYCLTNQEMPGQ